MSKKHTNSILAVRQGKAGLVYTVLCSNSVHYSYEGISSLINVLGISVEI
jgi:hypothetical protein